MGDFLAADLYRRLTQGLAEITAKPGFEIITMVVTVKAYPAIGQRTGESVCVAGIRIDTPKPTWIRLFPVHFRELQVLKQFRKWQVIRLRVQRGTTDLRQESYKPDLDTLQLGIEIPTQSGKWATRWEIVDGLVDEFTACEYLRGGREQKTLAPSLGLITPRTIKSLSVEINDEYIAHRKPVHEQISLFGDAVSNLEPPPFKAVYSYLCQSPSCQGHNQTLVDWESGQFARRQIATDGIEKALQQHRTKFLDELCADSNDTKFFIGNQHRYLHGFLILGVFYPKLGTRPTYTLDF